MGHRLMTIILSNPNGFLTNFFTGKFLGKFDVKWILKFPPHLACCYTTLRNINVSKKAINDKLQGNVATYLRCDRGC